MYNKRKVKERIQMIKLRKFYELISRNAEITVVNYKTKKELFKGSLKDIPDELDNCEVKDFNVSNNGDFTFLVK